MYQIKHKTKRGGGCVHTLPTNNAVMEQIIKLFKQRLDARAEKDGIVIGEVYKINGKWNWYLDTQA